MLISSGRAPTRICLLLALACLGGCRGDRGQSSSELIVFAASSLTEAFQDLEREFEAANDGVDVSLAFGGSQVLRLQIEQCAKADVFASADESHMEALIRAGWIPSSEVFAHNRLVVIVPAANPAKIESFADLPRAKRLVLGAPSVPVGRYTRTLLEHASVSYDPEFTSQVLAAVASEESNVRLVRAKVELGEADAAIVYQTDVSPSVRVRAIAIPAALNVRADYYIGVIERSSRPELARRWVAFIESEGGRRILAAHGFSAE
jgi:molybdate transport system substrate-binding protein